MAWLKMRSKAGNEIMVTESIYNNMFKDNGCYSLVKETKSNLEEDKQKEVVLKSGKQISKPRSNENSINRKSTKETIS